MYSMFLTKCSDDVRVLSFLQRKLDHDGKMTSSHIRHKIITILQYKTPKIRPENVRAGLSYTVASRELVRQVPTQRSLYPLYFRAIPNTPYTIRQKEGNYNNEK